MTVASSTRRGLETVPVASLANGHRLELHLHVLEGARPGPTLGLTAGIHGDEPLGCETVRQVLEAVDPETLAGTIVGLPVANPYAHQALTRNTPLDMTNLNRVFPGSPDGTFSDLLAATVCETMLERAEYIVDFHSGGNFATVDYVYIHDDDAELARAFGCELLYRGPSFAGSFGDHARERGVPTVVSELGGGQQRTAHYLEKGVRGTLNVMRHLGMLDGEPELPERQRVVTEMRVIRPHHGGVLLSRHGAEELGRTVPGGDELGRVISPFTFEELEVIRAPFEESILVLTREAITNLDVGEYGYMVADATTAQPA